MCPSSASMRPFAPTRGRSGSGVARKPPASERHDPGERMREHEAQDLLVALRREDVRVRRHAAPPPRASVEFRRP